MAEMTVEEMETAIKEIDRGVIKKNSKLDLSDKEKSKVWDKLEKEIQEIKKQGGMVDYSYFDGIW